MGGSGSWSTDSDDSASQAHTPVSGSYSSGKSANGTSQAVHSGHARNDRGVAAASKEGSSKGDGGQPSGDGIEGLGPRNWLQGRMAQHDSEKRHRQHSWLTVLEPEFVDRSDDK